MNIRWDEQKNEWLILNRRISFEEIAHWILVGDYLDIVDNPTRENQQYFVMTIHDYTWLVPFVLDDESNIILKTAYPSRKFHQRYGGGQDEVD